MITQDDVYSVLIPVIDLSVGSYLYQVSDGSGGTKSSIFKSKDSFSKGLHPYIILDIATRTQHNGYRSLVYHNDDGDRVTEILNDFFITVGCYGENATGVIGHFESSLIRQDILNLVSQGNKAAIVSTLPAASDVFRQDNQTIEFSSLILKMTMTDHVIETEDGIENISYDLNFRYSPSEDNIF